MLTDLRYALRSLRKQPGFTAAAVLALEVDPRDPLTLALTAAVLVAVAATAVYLPARRAARVDPMEALRYE